jgi:hypothetical protein
MAKVLSAAIGILFIGIGLIGFSKNPVIGTGVNPVFETDALHNIVHIVSGLLFFVFSALRTQHTIVLMKIFGVVYFLLGVLGFIIFGSLGAGNLLGFLHVNGADNLLHMVLGAVIFIAGMVG